MNHLTEAGTEIRDATPGGIGGITAIHNDAVLHTMAIWNEALVDAADRMAWLAARRDAGYPVLVAAEGGQVLGYAAFGDWRAWEGYRRTVEHSVYVRADQRGRGLGRALLAALIGRARDCGKHVMVAGIEGGNTASIRLHEGLGFEPVGRFREVGTKFGQWLDLAVMQLVLTPGEAPPPRLR